MLFLCPVPMVSVPNMLRVERTTLDWKRYSAPDKSVFHARAAAAAGITDAHLPASDDGTSAWALP